MAPSRIALIVVISAAVVTARLVGGTVGLLITAVLCFGMGAFWWVQAEAIVDSLRATERLRTEHARSTQLMASKVFAAVLVIVGLACLIVAVTS